MPSVDDHFKQISHNNNLLKVIRGEKDEYCDWEITIIYLNALHYIEAYFASIGIHSADHGERLRSIGSDHTIKKLYADYRHLFDCSRDTRYEFKWKNGEFITKQVEPHFNNIKKIVEGLLRKSPK